MVCPWNHDSCAKTYQLGLGLNPGTWLFTGKTCWYLWMFILTFRCKIRALYQLYWKSYSYIYSYIPEAAFNSIGNIHLLRFITPSVIPQCYPGTTKPDGRIMENQHPWDPIPRKFTRQRRCPSLVLIIEIPADGDVFFFGGHMGTGPSGLKQLRHTWNHPS